MSLHRNIYAVCTEFTPDCGSGSVSHITRTSSITWIWRFVARAESTICPPSLCGKRVRCADWTQPIWVPTSRSIGCANGSSYQFQWTAPALVCSCICRYSWPTITRTIGNYSMTNKPPRGREPDRCPPVNRYAYTSRCIIYCWPLYMYIYIYIYMYELHHRSTIYRIAAH